MDIAAAKQRKSTAKQGITRVEKLLAGDTSVWTLSEAKTRETQLEKQWHTFLEAWGHLEVEAATDAEREEFRKEHEEIAERVETMEVKLGWIKSNLMPAASPHGSRASSFAGSNRSEASSHSRPQLQVKLPKLDFSSFSGDYKEWNTFRDIFNSLIHDNDGMSEVTKFQYLLSKLTDEPKSLLSSLSVSAANYNVALEILRERYENEKVTVFEHFKTIFGLKPVQPESAKSLRTLVDSMTREIRSLGNFGYELVGNPYVDAIYTFMAVQRLDSKTYELWNMSTDDASLPKWDDLRKFIDRRCRDLESRDSSSQVLDSARVKQDKGQSFKASNDTQSKESHKCFACGDVSHFMYKCTNFNNMSVQERKTIVSSNKLCFNCLQSGHRSLDCLSKSKCRVCNKTHHTSLHEVGTTNQVTGQQFPIKPQTHTGLHVAAAKAKKGNDGHLVLVPSAIIRVRDSRNRLINCRALVDQCGQHSCISEEMVTRLGLARTKATSALHSLGEERVNKVKGQVTFTLKSMHSKFTCEVDAVVLPRITGFQPQRKVQTPPDLSQIRDLQMADPRWYEPGRIDILLDSKVYAKLLLDGVKKGSNNEVIVQNTELGWIMSGSVPCSSGTSDKQLTVLHISAEVESDVKKFLAIEDLPEMPVCTWTKEELECDEYFYQTHQRLPDGRFMVSLPFKSNVEQLGKSKGIAIQRLTSTERRLARQPDKLGMYLDFMGEYESLNHMREVPYMSIADSVYLPHHYVEKESTTTKLRVVFDASCKTSSGVSVNDTMMIGPKLQDDVHSILLRFRLHRIGITADVEKMFRQIMVRPEDRRYQHILWREDFGARLKDFELTTTTYGTAAAPYLATKCIKQLTVDEADRFPEAAQAVAEDAYMDDILTGTSTVEEAVVLQDELIGLYGAAQFPLRKFMSNCSLLLSRIPAALRAVDTDNVFDSDDAYKALGISWDFRKDQFFFKVPPLSLRSVITKRTISSDAAKLFDPNGLISPVLVRAKLLLQRIWSAKLDWDEPVSNSIRDEWLEYHSDIGNVSNIRLNRCVRPFSSNRVELHGFSDASEKAYGAVVYLVDTAADGTRCSSLLISKTKVAPLRQVTIQRLELNGATLLAKLLKLVISSMSTKRNQNLQMDITAWTDSTTVLHWIQKPARSWDTFIANRVATIQTETAGIPWKHVRTHENPADFASRGQSAQDLHQNSLWWEGPQWLTKCHAEWPKPLPFTDQELVNLEARKVNLLITSEETLDQNAILNHFSTLQRLIGATGYVFRFVNLIRYRKRPPKEFALTMDERRSALMFWVGWVQRESYQAEIKDLQKKRNVASTIANLSPFLDDEGIIRVGGRLRNAILLPESTKHPMLLPKDSHLSMLVVRDAHKRTLHGGQTLTLATLRQDFWIPSARGIIDSLIHKCVVCCRFRGAHLQPMMGDLPGSRVNPASVFEETGTDFAGPLQIKTWAGRGHKSVKGYICLFVCMATRAIHLEPVSELTTAAFLAALDRFIAIRGKPRKIHSDNGSNYVGAEQELRELFSVLQDSSDQIGNRLANDGIDWSFIPPHGPHFGGIWESGVKSVKGHLRKIFGCQSFTYEELDTALAKISCALNSRPLHPMSNSPDDLDALTPGHFLIGRPMNAIPHPDLQHLKWNRLDRWQKLQQVTQDFWQRWTQSCVLEMQQRKKWTKSQENVKVGDFVIIHDDSQPPAKWKMGRVVEVHPSKDNVVRSVIVNTATGQYSRPVVKLTVLPFVTDDSTM